MLEICQVIVSVLISEEPTTNQVLSQVLDFKDNIEREIKELYLEDSTPWVIGFSGGKDSTAVLQLIFDALSQLSVSQLTKELHVLSNDTLVENPNVIKFLDSQLSMIRKFGKNKLFAHQPNLFHVAKSTPKLGDTFWLNLIGKGYPSPNQWFRWCTERMKIKPTSAYIIDVVNEQGEAIIVLGTRKAESSNRSVSIQKYEIPGLKLRKHTLPNAYVYAPIVEMSNQEVWAYLINYPNQWGSDNQKLLSLYRSASDVMECPLVVDNTTPSCGNSRFGCWVCTVVQKDRSMSHMVQNGEEWMLPMLEFRNWLYDIRNDKLKRQNRRRNGEEGLGPFSIETRKDILERLLTVENEIGVPLISKNELIAIQYQWNYDGYFDFSVAEIYSIVKGDNSMLAKDEDKTKEEELMLLEKSCAKYGVSTNHIQELMELEKAQRVYLRRHTIHQDIKDKIEKFARENN